MTAITPEVKHPPPLDQGFVPAVLFDREFVRRAAADPGSEPLELALTRPDGTVFRHRTRILPHAGANRTLNLRHLERLVKFLLWMQGGSEVLLAPAGAGPAGELAAELAGIYGPGGAREFDAGILGRRMFLDEMRVAACRTEDLPPARARAVALGRHLDGCRIGFDLGGSDRKCAAVIDGEVVHSEEVEWNPYFESDPEYHYAGVMDSLRRAAAKLPRVDAIGGSAAGVYVDNEPRVASLFRGVSETDFAAKVRPMFKRLRAAWNDVPFEVANDGEVTALAASLSLKDNAILGISMGTSLAAGYCDPQGHITSWLNELAFVPVDFRAEAPRDEWSGDQGCGVQYFSQQAVARLAPAAGFRFAADMPFPEQLAEVQRCLAAGDDRARAVFETIGCYFGYTIAWFAEFYDFRHLLILGRVTSGAGGEIVLERGRAVLEDEFPELAARIALTTPDEQFKRHGQAIAAASLPALAR